MAAICPASSGPKVIGEPAFEMVPCAVGTAPLPSVNVPGPNTRNRAQPGRVPKFVNGHRPLSEPLIGSEVPGGGNCDRLSGPCQKELSPRHSQVNCIRR